MRQLVIPKQRMTPSFSVNNTREPTSRSDMIIISDDENDNDVSIVFENVEYVSDAPCCKEECTRRHKEGGALYVSTNADDVTHRGTSSRHHKKPHRCGREPRNSFYDAYGPLSDLEEGKSTPSITSQYSSPCSGPTSSCRVRSNKAAVSVINKIRNSVDSGLETCEEEEDVLEDEYVPQQGAMVFVKVEDSSWWHPGRVEEWVIQLFQPVRCKVKINSATAALVTADLLAYWNPPNRTLPVRCPVIACPRDPLHDVDRKYYAGLVYKSLSADNKHYYFIFFEREGVQQVHYSRVRAVCDGYNNMADFRNRNSLWLHLEECLQRYEAEIELRDGVITERNSPEVEPEPENCCTDAERHGHDGIASQTEAEEEEQEQEEQVGTQEVEDEEGYDEEFNNEESEIVGNRDDQENNNYRSIEDGTDDENTTTPEECFSLPTLTPPKPGDRVFVKVAGSLSWKRGQVDEVIKKCDTSVMKYMINVDQADTVVVTGNCLAYWSSLPRKTRLPVGTRVIAIPERAHWDEESAFYAGLILESPGPKRRHLVFFERGDARYLRLKRVRLVCDSSENVWEDMDSECQEFVQSFIVEGHRNNVEVEAGDEVEVKLNGNKRKAEVVEVDRSLVKVKFRENDRTKWIFRSASLLFPSGRSSETISNEKGPSRLVINIKSTAEGMADTRSVVRSDTTAETSVAAKVDASVDYNITATKCTTVDSITPSNDIIVSSKTSSANDAFVDNSFTNDNSVDTSVTNDSTADSITSASNTATVDYITDAAIVAAATNTVNNHAVTDTTVRSNVITAKVTRVPASKNTVTNTPASVRGFTINDIISTTISPTTSVRTSNTTVTSKSADKGFLMNEAISTSAIAVASREKSGRVKSNETAACSAVIQCEHDGNSANTNLLTTANIPRIDNTEIPYSASPFSDVAMRPRNVPDLIPYSIPTFDSSHGAVPPYSTTTPYSNFPIHPTAIRYSTITSNYDSETNNLSAIPFYSTPCNSIDTNVGVSTDNAALDIHNISSNKVPIFPWTINAPPINFSASLGSSTSYLTRVSNPIDTENIAVSYHDIGITRPSNISEQSEIIATYNYTPPVCGIPAAPIHTTDIVNYHDVGILGTRLSPAARDIFGASSINTTDRLATNYRDIGFPHLSNISEHTTEELSSFCQTTSSRDIPAMTSNTIDRIAADRIATDRIATDRLATDRIATDRIANYCNIGIARPSHILEKTTEKMPAFKETAAAGSIPDTTSNTTDRIATNYRDVRIACSSKTSEHTTEKVSTFHRTKATRDIHAPTSNSTDPSATKYRDTGIEIPRHSNASEHSRDELSAIKHTAARHIIPVTTSIISDRAPTKYPARDFDDATVDPIAAKYCDIGVAHDSNISAARDIPATSSKATDPVATKCHDVGISGHSKVSEPKIDQEYAAAFKRASAAFGISASSSSTKDDNATYHRNIGVTRYTSAECDVDPLISDKSVTKYRDFNVSRPSNTFEHTTDKISASKQSSARHTVATSDNSDPIASKCRDTGISRQSEHTTENISAVQRISSASDIPPVISDNTDTILDLNDPRSSKTPEHTTEKLSSKQTSARHNAAASDTTDRIATKHRDTAISRHSDASEHTTTKITALEDTPARHVTSVATITDRAADKDRNIDIPQRPKTEKLSASKHSTASHDIPATTSNITGSVATKCRVVGVSRPERTSEEKSALKHASTAEGGIPAVTRTTVDITPCYVDLSSFNTLMNPTKKSSTASISDSVDITTTRPRKNEPNRLFTLPCAIDTEIPLRKTSKIKMTAYVKTRTTDDEDADSTSVVSDPTTTSDSASKSAPTDEQSSGRKNESGLNLEKNSLAETRLFSHRCSRRCVNKAPFRKKMVYSVNPLSVSVSCGWRRDILTDSGEPRIRYTAPCGLTLLNMKAVQRYLEMVFSKMTVDLFDFDPAVSLVRYVYNKDYIRIVDLSHGAEEVKVSVFNDLDGSLPASFRYSTTCVRPSGSKSLRVPSRLRSSCECEDDCSDRRKCPCRRRVRPSDEGYIYRRLMKKSSTEIFECNERCSCSENCHNRVAQNRLQLGLQVFRTVDKGWGVRCLYDIPKGTFICSYVGEVLTTSEAAEEEKKHGKEYFVVLKQPKEQEKRGKDVDIFSASKKDKEDAKKARRQDPSSSRTDKKRKNDVEEENGKRKKWRKEVDMDWKSNKDTDDVAPRDHANMKLERSMHERTQSSLTYTVDTKTETYVLNSRGLGNVARFFNYSCNPNMFSQGVSCEPNLQTLAFFAKERISAGEELTWDYCAVPL